MSTDRGTDKGDTVHIYNGILLSHKEEWNNAICSNMNGHRDYHTKWSQRKRQIPYANQFSKFYLTMAYSNTLKVEKLISWVLTSPRISITEDFLWQDFIITVLHEIKQMMNSELIITHISLSSPCRRAKEKRHTFKPIF